MTGIYKIQSTLKPNKIYIGSTSDLKHRKRQHSHQLKHNKHFNKKLQNHFNKYGNGDLIYSVLLECESGDLIKHEQYYINKIKPWFNNAPIAGSCLGSKHSEESKKALSDRQKGRKLSEDHKRNIGLGNKGKVLSEETKMKIGNANKGKIRSNELKQIWSKLKEGNKCNLGHKRTEESKRRQSEKMMGFGKGRKLTQETKDKIRIKLIGNKNGKKNKDTAFA